MTKPIHPVWRSLIAAAAMFSTITAIHARPLGVDVSSYQGAPNWSSARSCGIEFAIAKATEGVSINDGDFTYNMSNGKAAGVYMGAYHFAHPNLNSPQSEASHFWSVASPYIKNDGKSIEPTLDFEVFSGVVGASSYSDWANQWFNDILNNGGNAGLSLKPIIYTSACSCGFNSSIDAWTPWIANYNGQGSQTGSPWNTCTGCNVWGGWSVWQYTDAAGVCGISGGVDGDVYNGTSAQMVSELVIAAAAAPAQTWTSVNGGPIQMNTDGTLEIFGVQGTTAKHQHQATPNGSWTALINMGGITAIAGIASARNSDGRLEVFGYNTADGTVYHQYQTAPHQGFTQWFQMGSSAGVTNLVAVTNLDGRMEVFGIKNGTVWHDYQSTAGGAWHGWGSHGGVVKAGYAVGRNGDGRLEILGVGTDGNVWHDWQTSAGGAWNGWVSMGGSGMNQYLAVANNADGRLDVYGCKSDGHAWHNYQVKGGGGAWNGWGDTGIVGGSGRGGMCIGINPDGRLEVFCSTTSGVVWHRYQNVKNGDWTPWYSLGGTALDLHLFCANNANGSLQVFGIHTGDNNIWTNYQTTPGGGWNGWFSMGNAGMMFYYGQP